MSNKIKNSQTNERLLSLVQQVGLGMMTVAATFGMLELPDHPNSRIIIPGQPAFAFASEIENVENNPVRREREESAPHFISYSISQRTPGRSTKK